jgi:hypothetical protein
MQNRQIEGRSILTDENGQPVLATLNMRPSKASPNRLKCSLIAKVGDEQIAFPFCSSQVPDSSGTTVEFRIECN